MRANEGSVDRYLRFAAALVLFAVALMFPHLGWLNPLLWVVGTVLVVTSIVGFCPLYMLLGINTCKR